MKNKSMNPVAVFVGIFLVLTGFSSTALGVAMGGLSGSRCTPSIVGDSDSVHIKLTFKSYGWAAARAWATFITPSGETVGLNSILEWPEMSELKYTGGDYAARPGYPASHNALTVWEREIPVAKLYELYGLGIYQVKGRVKWEPRDGRTASDEYTKVIGTFQLLSDAEMKDIPSGDSRTLTDSYNVIPNSNQPLFVTVDIGDDFWRSGEQLSIRNIQTQMKYFSRLGIRRVYWILVPNYYNMKATFRDYSDKTLGDVVQAAHDANLEFYYIFKPFETCSPIEVPQNISLPNETAWFPSLIGRRKVRNHFFEKNEHLYLQRRPIGTSWIDKKISAVKLVNKDDSAVSIKPEDLKIWVSHINGDFRLYEKPFMAEEKIEERDGVSVRVFHFSNLDLSKDDNYILFECTNTDGSEKFSNKSSKLIELIDENGTLIPSTWDQGKITASSLKSALIRWWMWDTGKKGLPEGVSIPQDYGKTIQNTGFWFDGRVRVADPIRTLDAKAVQANAQLRYNGCIAAVKGRRTFLPTPQPMHKEVRDYWLSHIQDFIDAKADGVDFRLGIHSAESITPEEFGFGKVVVDAYQKKHGVNIVDDPNRFDAALWKKLQGDAYTEFLVEARDMTRKNNMSMQLHINALLGTEIPFWTRNNILTSIEWQWRTWLEKDLADEVLLKLLPWIWGSASGAGKEFIQEIYTVTKPRNINVYSEWRFDCWWMVQDPLKTIQKEFTPEDKERLIKRAEWSFTNPDTAAILLYEAFDLAYLNAETGETVESAVFDDLLESTIRKYWGEK